MQQRLKLKPREDRRLRSGHLWVFANEVAAAPEGGQPGDLVEVITHGGDSLGSALYHPHSLISARLLGGRFEELDEAFFRPRFAQAAALRRTLFPHDTCCRLVHGESDFLPGLIVDRFGDYLVVQTLSAGMDRRLETIGAVLAELFAPAGILERNDSALRAYEGLPERSGVLRGGWEGACRIEENGLHYQVDLLAGQKTGFFLDQKLNRRVVGSLARGRRVLDCFCNQGGFALNAARGGAVETIGVDVSAGAIAACRANAALNRLEAVTLVESDVFSYLRDAVGQGQEFDLVVIDPPSFAPRKKDVANAKKAYRRLNELGMRLLASDGLLVTASCSFHLHEEVFHQLVREAAVRAGRSLQLLEQRMQSPDHPVLPAMPETRYLKLGIFRVLSA